MVPKRNLQYGPVDFPRSFSQCSHLLQNDRVTERRADTLQEEIEAPKVVEAEVQNNAQRDKTRDAMYEW